MKCENVFTDPACLIVYLVSAYNHFTVVIGVFAIQNKRAGVKRIENPACCLVKRTILCNKTMRIRSVLKRVTHTSTVSRDCC